MTANKYKNELVLEIAGEKILLRPTFENIAAFESNVMGIPIMAFNMSKGDLNSLLTMSQTTQLIYYFQAEKKFTLEDIHLMVMDEGLAVTAKALPFLGKIATGAKVDNKVTNTDKKKDA